MSEREADTQASKQVDRQRDRHSGLPERMKTTEKSECACNKQTSKHEDAQTARQTGKQREWILETKGREKERLAR